MDPTRYPPLLPKGMNAAAPMTDPTALMWLSLFTGVPPNFPGMPLNFPGWWNMAGMPAPFPPAAAAAPFLTAAAPSPAQFPAATMMMTTTTTTTTTEQVDPSANTSVQDATAASSLIAIPCAANAVAVAPAAEATIAAAAAVPAAIESSACTYPYTNAEKQVIDTLEDVMTRCFPAATIHGTGKWWYSLEQCRKEFDAVGKLHGFKLKNQGGQLVCSRAFQIRSKAALQLAATAKRRNKVRKAPSLQPPVGCCFRVTYAKVANQKRRPDDAPPGAYFIPFANYTHSHGCTPHASQIVTDLMEAVVGVDAAAAEPTEPTVQVEPLNTTGTTAQGALGTEPTDPSGMVEPSELSTLPHRDVLSEMVCIPIAATAAATPQGTYRYSDAQLERISDVEELLKRTFPLTTMDGTGRWWKDLASLRSEINSVGKLNGFSVRTQGHKLVCSLANHTKAKVALMLEKVAQTAKDKQRKRRSKIVGCCFYITYVKVFEQRRRPKDAPPGSIYIAQANFRHSNGCTLSLPQVDDGAEEILHSLIVAVEQEHPVSPPAPVAPKKIRHAFVTIPPQFDMYTETEMENINNLQEVMRRDFPIVTDNTGKWYTNLDSLRTELSAAGKEHGFMIRTQGGHLVCTRAHHHHGKLAFLEKRKAKTAVEQRRKRSSKTVGCCFRISYVVVSDDSYQKRRPKDAPPGSVFISNANYMHSNGCIPSAAQLVTQQISAGYYMKQLQKHKKLQTLLDVERYGGWDTKTYKQFLSEIFPPEVNINSSMISNVRLKVKQLLKKEDDKEAEAAAVDDVAIER